MIGYPEFARPGWSAIIRPGSSAAHSTSSLGVPRRFHRSVFTCATSRGNFYAGKETSIGRDASSSPIATIGILSLGLIAPIGAGPGTDQAITALTANAGGPTKSVTLVVNGHAESVQTRALTVDDVLLEEHIARAPDDALDVDPGAAVSDGETITYRAATTLTLVIDGVPQTIHSTADTVGTLLAQKNVAFDAHDKVVPAAATPLAADETVSVEHVSSWIEHRRKAFAPPVHDVASFALGLGATKTVAKGLPGIRETSYLVMRNATNRTAPPIRTILASRVIRPSRPTIVEAGIGRYAALANLAMTGFNGTVKLARAALAMVATAYSGNCSGCSGVTKLGTPAGHGIVAVDPQVIPLGSRLYIPGYGKAIAGDTGGAIHGNRIDLGFNSDGDAMQFGRRDVTVFVLHP